MLPFLSGDFRQPEAVRLPETRVYNCQNTSPKSDRLNRRLPAVHVR